MRADGYVGDLDDGTTTVAVHFADLWPGRYDVLETAYGPLPNAPRRYGRPV